jgi:protein O-mannosyl-transferase
VATRNNLLATLFFLGALLAYTYYIERGFKIRLLVISLVCFTLSVLSKSASVVLPLTLLLWDYYYDRKRDARWWQEKIPFLVIAVIFGIQTLTIRQDVVLPVDYNLIDRFFIFCYSLQDYLVRFVFPVQLSMSYAYPEKDGGFLPAYIYLSPFILAVIVWVLYKLPISRKVLTVGLLFFVLNIILSQSVLLIDNFKASRYAYLSYIGLFFIIGDVTEQLITASEGVQTRLKYLWAGLLVIAVVGFSALTHERNLVWRDTITLFDDVVSKQPNIAWVYANRGIAKYRNFDNSGAFDDMNRALELDPQFPLALYYRGLLHFDANEPDLALTDFDTTLVLLPEFANAYNDRGRVKMSLQDNEGAMADFSKAIELNEFFIEAYFNRGLLKGSLGDFEGSIVDYTSVISYAPDYADAYYMRGLAKADLNDLAGSCADAVTAQSLGNLDVSDYIAQYCSS